MTWRAIERSGPAWPNPHFLSLEAEARLRAGEPDAASRLLDEAATRAHEATRQFFHESEIHRLESRVQLGRDEPGALEAARAALDRSALAADRLASPPLQLRTALDRFLLERDHGDATRHRGSVAELVAAYAGQAETSDVRLARQALARSD